MGTKVTKALTPEEMTLLANIKSLVAELEGMQAPAVGEGGEGVQMARPMQQAMKMAPGGSEEDIDDQYEDDDVSKAIETGSSDESDATDNAEVRLKDIPDEDEDNLREVAKMFSKMINGGKVKKSSAPVDPNIEALHAVTKVLKSIGQRVEQQDAVLGEILDGLGVAKSVTPTRVQKSGKPVQSVDQEFMAQVFKSMADAFAQNNQNKDLSVEDNSTSVHKSMGGLVEALGKSGPWNM